MLFEFENKVADFIKANRLFEQADSLLLAVSGGADSTALLYAVSALKTANVLNADIVCAHIHHQLRGADADLDEDFVISRARELNIPITTKRLDVRGFARKNKLSIETAARKLRIETLLDIAKANDCKHIATAHHKNDNAETILQRLVRGTGFRGLGGIWPVRVFTDDIRFVRPLLCVSRDEIIEYLRKRNLKWRRDHTNADCTYRRNFIRHRLLPALQKDCNGSVVDSLAELADSARKFYSLVCNCADKAWTELADLSRNKVMLNLDMFLTQPPAVKVELIRRSLTALGSGERDLTQRHYESIFQLAKRQVGNKKIELPAGFVVRREYGNLIFARPKKSLPGKQINKSTTLKVPGQTRFGRYLIEATVLDTKGSMPDTRKKTKSRIQLVEQFDFDKLKLPLMVRLRETGDRFWPLGLASDKKVGKFLTAAKLPHRLRRKILVVADSEKIIWLWPIRISEQAKLTAGTRKILRLQITDTN
ncbi:MAG TPA: tRNA lysidine(34) synthetase TilS [Planctomycetes bacterium]|nr:tRNA lysidine(34) synthetase TilS [Planctomycetota bacterium]